MSSESRDFFETAQSIAERIQKQDFSKVLIISHIDADGLTAASAASMGLTREEIEHEVKFVKQLDEAVIAELQEIQRDKSNSATNSLNNGVLFWFTDLGSGMSKEISQFKPIITDHHAPTINDYEVPIHARTDLLAFSNVLEHQVDEYHLNPHLFNLDGTYDISGAGTVYLVVRAIDKKNIDLANLAVIGAVGDLQDSRFRQLTGTNRKILKDAEDSGKIKTIQDISLFGRETRPLPNLIQYSTDPYFPTLTMNEHNCIEFFKKLDIPLRANGRSRRWVDLTDDERRTVLSELMGLLLSRGIGHKDAKRLFAEVYTQPLETIGTALHDVKEFSTLLNSCGKYNKPEIGYKICLGDRGEHLNKAFHLLKGHKSILVEGMQFVRNQGINDHGLIQYFDAGDKIPDNIVGTIASMILGNNDADNNKPLFGFAIEANGDGLKVSARATQALVKKGLNLSEVMKQTSKVLGSGSVGGGHDIAAGATIPLDKQQEFLKLAEEIIGKQLGI
jgi:RecJ-like exonuclease